MIGCEIAVRLPKNKMEANNKIRNFFIIKCFDCADFIFIYEEQNVLLLTPLMQ